MTEQQEMMTSTFEGVVKWSGGRALLRKGTTFDDDHPLVTERPDLFERKAPDVDVKAPEPPIERGTRAPGEQRAAVETGMRRPGRPRKVA